jgi:hypothetical protein
MLGAFGDTCAHITCVMEIFLLLIELLFYFKKGSNVTFHIILKAAKGGSILPICERGTALAITFKFVHKFKCIFYAIAIAQDKLYFVTIFPNDIGLRADTH